MSCALVKAWNTVGAAVLNDGPIREARSLSTPNWLIHSHIQASSWDRMFVLKVCSGGARVKFTKFSNRADFQKLLIIGFANIFPSVVSGSCDNLENKNTGYL